MHALTSMLFGADMAFLLSPIKPFLVVLTFIPWAWLVSSKLDKDLMYWHLNRGMWNGIQLGAGTVGILAMLLIPIFWIGWPVAIICMLTPILIYWKVRNGIVPENKRFHLSSESISSRLEARRSAAASRSALINFKDPSGKEREVPQKEDSLYSTHLLAEDIIGPATEARATKIELVSGQNGFMVAQTIDSVKFRRDPVAADAGNLVIDYLKDIAGLDVQNRRRRQVGTFSMTSPSGSNKLTLTTAGSSSGQEIRIELNRSDVLDKPFDNLGLLPKQIESLRKFEDIQERTGVILLGTISGHGLTTLGYSILGRHDAYTTNIKTLEREIMLHRDGVDHQEFDPANPDLDFATNLQSILRRDPDVVLIGDIIDKGTASMAAIHTADSGPLIYVPQRSSGVKEQIVDWVKRVGDIKQAVKPLRAVINGRLLRSLCPNCKQAYRPTTEQLKKLHLPDNIQQLFKAGGKVQVKNKIENCPVCQGIGYFGLTGVFEVMVLDDAARKLIANNDLQGAYTHCRRNGMVFMQEASLQKVIEGLTTLEEVARVISQQKSGRQAQSAGA